jgi:hypothetical protein
MGQDQHGGSFAAHRPRRRPDRLLVLPASRPACLGRFRPAVIPGEMRVGRPGIDAFRWRGRHGRRRTDEAAPRAIERLDETASPFLGSGPRRQWSMVRRADAQCGGRIDVPDAPARSAFVALLPLSARRERSHRASRHRPAARPAAAPARHSIARAAARADNPARASSPAAIARDRRACSTADAPARRRRSCRLSRRRHQHTRPCAARGRAFGREHRHQRGRPSRQRRAPAPPTQPSRDQVGQRRQHALGRGGRIELRQPLARHGGQRPPRSARRRPRWRA